MNNPQGWYPGISDKTKFERTRTCVRFITTFGYGHLLPKDVAAAAAAYEEALYTGKGVKLAREALSRLLTK